MAWLVAMCKKLHIASSSRTTYASHQDHFLAFCDAFDKDPLTLSGSDLAEAVAYFALGHTSVSIPSYLSALQNLYDQHGAGPLPRGPAFLLAIRGLRRILGPADTVVRTKALSLEDLSRLVAALSPTDPASTCLAAQMLVAFFLCLRTEDHCAGRLRWGDVYPQVDGGVDFVVPPGKSCSDFRHVAVAPRADHLDVLSWLRRLASFVPPSHRTPSSPLFVSFRRSRAGAARYWASSRKEFIDSFKALVAHVLGVSPTLYAGYSLRRGGVTAMLTAEVPLPAIKQHVRWAPDSDAVFAYYDHSGRAQLLQPTQKLGASRVSIVAP